MHKDAERGCILDVGTSTGEWFPFLKKEGFQTIYGVELHERRAEQARAYGYKEVFHCEAQSVPLPDQSIDAAVSNEVFVHILRLEDKKNVLREMERLLKPGASFVFKNHTMAAAYNYSKYTCHEYCSFMTLDEVVTMIKESTSFEIADIKPTYYVYRPLEHSLRNRMRMLCGHLFIFMPLGVSGRRICNAYWDRRFFLNQSDSVYFKLRKPNR
jgi:ubiquinone/menaquinone biosynthesis C-methylase UbiE